MNKFLLLPILLLTATLSAHEQFFNLKDLKVSKAELEAISYNKDTTANAFYIYEDGYSRFQQEGDYNLLTDYKAKIKIRNKEGFEHDNVEIRLFKGEFGKEELHDLKDATPYLENGR